MHIFFENPSATAATVVTNEMYNDGAGNIYIGTNRGITQIKGGTTGSQNAGTSASPVVSTTAGDKYLSYYTGNSATSGDSRGIYLKHTMSGIGGGGEAARFYGSMTAAGATARGAHISLDFGTAGSITGLGTAITGTLHIPGAMTNGTYAVVNAEINADAATSNLTGATAKSFFRVGAIGDGTGAALIMDDIYLLDFINAAGSGKMLNSDITALTGKAGIPVSVNGSLYGYIPVVTGS